MIQDIHDDMMYMFRTILEPRLAYSSICLNAKVQIEDPAGRLMEVCPENSRHPEMEAIFYYGKKYPDLPRYLFRPGAYEIDETKQNNGCRVSSGEYKSVNLTVL